MKIYEGEKIPIGYGHAWYNWHNLSTTVYFVPFNIFIRWLRQLWFFLGSRDAEYKREQKIFRTGFEEGKKEGLKELDNVISKESKSIRKQNEKL